MHEFRSSLANLKFIKYLRFSFPNSRLPEGLRRRIYLTIFQMQERKVPLQIGFLNRSHAPRLPGLNAA